MHYNEKDLRSLQQAGVGSVSAAECRSRKFGCVVTDRRTAVQMKEKTCSSCSHLFLVRSETSFRRPLVICVNGDTVCDHCHNECLNSPDAKCPTCGGDLLPCPSLNKTIQKIIDDFQKMLEIPNNEMEVAVKPFAFGGFGKVYNATWGKQDVVVKVIKVQIDEHKNEAKKEADITIRLHHPNVILLFGTTWLNKKHFGIVMEKAENGSLDSWIGKVKNRKAAKIALGIVDGLEYVHSQKVIHRDIKPKNILMFGPKDDMIPKIADFGVAKVIHTVMTHSMVGEERYMAPEVKMNLRYGFSADIFSLAMMFFELFNSQPLKEASEEVQRYVMGVHAGNSRTIPEICPVPVSLRTVVERGLSHAQDDRPDLAEYRSALNDVITRDFDFQTGEVWYLNSPDDPNSSSCA